MDQRDEIRAFLTSRRAKVTPEAVDLVPGPKRRVPGLRRSEVAILANVSAEYYARLERSGLSGASDTVIEAIARALRLDEAEHAYLLDLARAAGGAAQARPQRRSTKQWRPRPLLQATLDAITTPAFVRNARMDLLAVNLPGRALYADVYRRPQRPANLARFAFLDLDLAQRFYPDWEAAADVCVTVLRSEAGRAPLDKDLQDLVGELSTRSKDFRTRWAACNVRVHAAGTKRFHHDIVGGLELGYESLELAAEPGLTLLVYTAQAGSPSDERLRLLASWAASLEPAELAGLPAPSHADRN